MESIGTSQIKQITERFFHQSGYRFKNRGGVCGIRRGKTRNKKKTLHNWRYTFQQYKRWK